MKILIVSQYFWPETFRINEVAASLREAGCDVTVLTGQPNYPDGVVFPGYRWWRVSRETHEGIPILRVPLVPRGRASAVKLVLNYLSFMIGGSLIGQHDAASAHQHRQTQDRDGGLHCRLSLSPD